MSYEIDERRAFNHDPDALLPPPWRPDLGDWFLFLGIIPLTLLLVLWCLPVAAAVHLIGGWKK